MSLNDLKSCDILLYKGTGAVSKLIQWKTTSAYSHVSVVVDGEMSLAIESNTGSQSGVRALDLRKLDAKIVDVFRIKKENGFKPEQVISYLVSCLGCKYDYPGVFYLGLLKVLGQQKKANEWQIKKDYFCSELVYEAFKSAGLDIVPQIGSSETTSPGDIAKSPILQLIGTEKQEQ